MGGGLGSSLYKYLLGTRTNLRLIFISVVGLVSSFGFGFEFGFGFSFSFGFGFGFCFGYGSVSVSVCVFVFSYDTGRKFFLMSLVLSLIYCSTLLQFLKSVSDKILCKRSTRLPRSYFPFLVKSNSC